MCGTSAIYASYMLDLVPYREMLTRFATPDKKNPGYDSTGHRGGHIDESSMVHNHVALEGETTSVICQSSGPLSVPFCLALSPPFPLQNVCFG